MAPSLIVEPALREAFLRNGFAVTPLLTADDIAELLALYRDASPAMTSGFYTTLWSENLEYRRKVRDTITRVLRQRLEPLIGPAKFILTQFAVKQGGKTGTECPLHQDWSMCDETQHDSVSVWCPLIDVARENGTLAVVPGSHRLASRIRPNMPSDFYYSPVSVLHEVFQTRYLRDLPMPAGYSVLYDGALTHGSRPNQSDRDRVAVVASLVAPQTPVMHYWMPSPTRIEAFVVEDDFYTARVALGSRPAGEPAAVTTVLPDAPPLTEGDFMKQTADVDRDPRVDMGSPTDDQAPAASGFIDATIAERVDRLGYAVIDLLSAAEVERLRAAYDSMVEGTAGGFHATMYSPSVERRRAVYELIRPLVMERIRPLLRGYSLRVANWVVKEAGQGDSTVGFHQDWSFIDERRARSLNLWIPLVDVDQHNGCLEMVGGSHRVSPELRGHERQCRFDALAPTLREHYTTPLPMKAGQGALYDGALLHASAHNESGRRRLAIGTVLTPDGEQLVHAHRVSPDTVEVFAVDDAFFWRHSPGARPDAVISLGLSASRTSQHGDDVIASLVPAQTRA